MARATNRRFAKFAPPVDMRAVTNEQATLNWRRALQLGHVVHNQGWSFECSSCGRSGSVGHESGAVIITGQLFNGERCPK